MPQISRDELNRHWFFRLECNGIRSLPRHPRGALVPFDQTRASYSAAHSSKGISIVTREHSWQVDGITKTLLRQTTALGYIVSVHRVGSSLLGTIGPSVEMHAVDQSGKLPPQIARCNDGDGEDEAYRCACPLAQSVGINVEDG